MKKLPVFPLILLSCSPVLAADFVFNVPLQLEQIPKGIPQAKVICEVFSYSDNRQPIASGYTIHTIHSQFGRLDKNVVVRVNYHAMQRHRKPHQYHCRLQLLLPWTQPSWQTPSVDAELPILQPQENSSLQVEVSGIIKTEEPR
ncbi:MAG: hypothetical protein PVG66_06850 [Chromatiales bacterium]|jgi:hypothetical protein